MFKKFTDGCVSLVNRFLPDPYIFCIVLTIIVFIGAIPATGAWDSQCRWYSYSFWEMLLLTLLLSRELSEPSLKLHHLPLRKLSS